MVSTRSTTNMSEEDGNSGDELNTTMLNQGASAQQQQQTSVLEAQIKAMAKQLQDLQNAIAKISAPNDTATTSNEQAPIFTAPSSVSGAEASGVSIVETLADLNRTLATTRSNTIKNYMIFRNLMAGPKIGQCFANRFI